MVNPYQKYRETKLWRTIEKALEDLIKNQDISITTEKTYVIGYLCERLNKETEN